MDEKEERNIGPSLEQVIDVIRQSTGHTKYAIDADTWIENDLHICGDDGTELLEECEQAFRVKLGTEEDGIKKVFSLAENEYLFSSEGIDFLCIGRLLRWLRGIPDPVIRDLTVGELHQAIVQAKREQEIRAHDCI